MSHIEDGDILFPTTDDEEETTKVASLVCYLNHRAAVHCIATARVPEREQIAEDLRMEGKNALVDPESRIFGYDDAISVGDPYFGISLDFVCRRDGDITETGFVNLHMMSDAGRVLRFSWK